MIRLLAIFLSIAVAQGGFRITHVEKGSVYDKLGLKEGDLVTEVNGQSAGIQTGERTELFEKEGSVKVKMIRDGKEGILKIRIKKGK